MKTLQISGVVGWYYGQSSRPEQRTGAIYDEITAQADRIRVALNDTPIIDAHLDEHTTARQDKGPARDPGRYQPGAPDAGQAPSTGSDTIVAGSEVHFRHIRIRELAGNPPVPEAAGRPDEGFRRLTNGLDLAGWRAAPDIWGRWRSHAGTLANDGTGQDHLAKDLWTQEAFDNFIVQVDWRLVGEPRDRPVAVVLPDGSEAVDQTGRPITVMVPDAGDSGIYLRGSTDCLVHIGCRPVGSGAIAGYRANPALPVEIRREVIPLIAAEICISSRCPERRY
ncbi:MAG: DUF1080 domain-containing protein [Sedimentisphaerales bacterium]|nr:DUF1080 domain-containing protein [Sedimentisphaerales bacterium]